MWNDLNILDKSRIIQLAVQNGITSLSKIQQLYDSSVQKSDDYDYVGYYNKYPNDLFTHQEGQHYTDEFKLPSHPTFSNESIYSNRQTPGGNWSRISNNNGQQWNFTPSDWQLSQKGYLPKVIDYLIVSEPQGVTLTDKYGRNPKIDGDLWGGVLPEIEVTPYYAKGGQIHIAPSKRGTFTAAAKKHGKSVQAFASQVLANKDNYSPAMVKKATFAHNAAGWKHDDGGNLTLADVQDYFWRGDREGYEKAMQQYRQQQNTPVVNRQLINNSVPPEVELPEVIVTPDSQQTNWTSEDINNSVYEKTPKIIHYNDYQGRQAMLAAQHDPLLNIAGLAVTAPLIAGNPVTGALLGTIGDAAKYGFKAMDFLYSPSKWLNPVTGNKLLSPVLGTSADALVQSAFVTEGLKGLYDQYKNGTLSNYGETAQNTLMTLPIVGPAVASTVSGIRYVTPYLQAMQRGIRNKYRLADKWINAPERLRNLSQLAETLAREQEKLSTEAQRNLLQLQQKNFIPSVNPNSSFRRLLAFDMFRRTPFYNNEASISKATSVQQVDAAFRRLRKQSPEGVHFKTTIHDNGMVTQEMAPQNIDFSKLSKDDIIRLIARRLADQGRDIYKEQKFEDFKKELSDAVDFIKTNNGWLIKDKNPITVSGGYNPNNYIETEYLIHDYNDLAKLPLQGKIKFSESSGEKAFGIFDTSTMTSRIERTKTEGATRGGELLDLPEEYVQRLKHNIDYVKQELPGFKPFGSSVGVTEAKFPHATHDIDGYMLESDWEKWYQANKHKYSIETKSGGSTYTINMFPELGEEGLIDVNIIRGNERGSITGSRALELARQYFPEQYSAAVLESSRTGKSIEECLNITPKEVFNAYDPSVKTIADQFEINATGPTKRKQIGRPYVYLSNADPDKVAEGLKIFAQAHGAKTFFPASLEELTDAKANLEILNKIGMKGDLEEIASNPQKMKNALDYWYLDKTIRMRGINPYQAPEGLEGQDILYKGTHEWLGAGNTGGSAKGAGLNSVTLGTSSEYPYQTYWQLQSSKPITGTLDDKIRQINRFLGDYDYNYTLEEKELIKQIARNHNIDISLEDFNNSEDLLNTLPAQSNDSKAILQELSDIMNIQALTRDYIYGTGRYSSINGKIPDDTFMMYSSPDAGGSSPVGIPWRNKQLSSIKVEEDSPAYSFQDYSHKIALRRPEEAYQPNPELEYLDIGLDRDTYVKPINISGLASSNYLINYAPQRRMLQREGLLKSTKEAIEKAVQEITKLREKASSLHRQSFKNSLKSEDLLWQADKIERIRETRKDNIREISMALTGISLLGGSAAIAASTAIQKSRAKDKIDTMTLEELKDFYKSKEFMSLPHSSRVYVKERIKQLSSKTKNTKSTGGPLYPFSFSKIPYIKTPVVRY